MFNSLTIKKRTAVEVIADFSFYLFILTEVIYQHTIIGQIGIIILILSLSLFMISRQSVKFSYFFGFYALFIFYNLINTSFGVPVNNGASVEMLKTLILNLVILFLLFNYFVLRNNMRLILKVYIVAVLFATGIVVIKSLPDIFIMNLGHDIEVNSNFISIVSSVSYLICFYFYLESKDKIKKGILNILFNNIILFWFLGIVLLTGSRKGLIISTLGTIILLFLIYPKKRIRYLALSFSILLCSYYLIMHLPFLYNILGVKIDSLLNYVNGGAGDNSISTRSTLVERGWDYFLKKPLFGYGLDNFRFLPGTYGVYSHNNFIELLVSGGIIGFLLYYVNYLIVIYLSFKRKNKDNIIKLTLTIIILLILVEYALVTYYVRMYMIFIIMGIAFVKIIKNKERRMK